MRRRRARALLVFSLCVVAYSACRLQRPPGVPRQPAPDAVHARAPDRTRAAHDPIADGTAPPRAQIAFDPNAVLPALRVSVRDGRSGAPSDANATALTEGESAALFAQLEPLPDPSAQHGVAPSLRLPSAPPPRTASVQPIAWSAPKARPVAEMAIMNASVVKSLAAPEITPQGAVRDTPEVQVRFASPMVAVERVDSEPPAIATIAPAVEGRWRWLDTRVAAFTAHSGFPMGSEFRVTVAAGARSLDGAVLLQATSATFQTPALAIARRHPETPVGPDTPLAIVFNQAFDPVAVSRFLSVSSARNEQQIAFRMISLDEARERWARIPNLELPKDLDDPKRLARMLIVAPASHWPSGGDVDVRLAAGAPSREGPRLAEGDASWFTIARRFTLRGIACGHDSSEPRLAGARCPIEDDVELRFSNEIDRASYRSRNVQIVGAAFDDHWMHDASVMLTAPAKAGAQFEVAVSDELRDIYGQPLSGVRRAAFTTVRPRIEPGLSAPEGLHVLDPRFEIPQWVVSAQALPALRVQLFRVAPSDYPAFSAYEDGKRKMPPGRRVFDQTYSVGRREGIHLRIDLRPALNASGLGHVIAIASSVGGGESLAASAWLQVTKLALVARADSDKIEAFVQQLGPEHANAPVAGARASLVAGHAAPEAPPVTTDPEGHVVLVRPALGREPGARAHSDEEAPSARLEVETATDSTFAVMGARYYGIREQNAFFYVTDDRFTYKPGETVYVKGWVRYANARVNPQLARPERGDAVEYSLKDALGNELSQGRCAFSDEGGFDLAVTLPPNANLGTATFSFSTAKASHRHPIEIREFRAPAYAVTLNDDVTHSATRPLFLGESIEMQAEAKYYAGGTLRGAHVEWNARLTPARYRPPGWDGYVFNPELWREYLRWGASRELAIEAHDAGALGAAGSARVSIGIAGLVGQQPALLDVDAIVTDVDRQRVRQSSRAILVHPSEAYVGLRALPDGSGVEAIATDVDGHARAGLPIEISITDVLGSEHDRDDAQRRCSQHCTLTSALTPVVCQMAARDPERDYTASAVVTDARGRKNRAQLEIPKRTPVAVAHGFEVVADRTLYRPGESAKLAIHSQQVPAVALVSYSRQGVIAQRRLELKEPVTDVTLPIEASFVPNVFVEVDRVAPQPPAQRKAEPPLPELDHARLELEVDLESARLAVSAHPSAPLIGPGDQATFEVEVLRDQKPVEGAEVALMVVDEAVLALSTRRFIDPLFGFYPELRPSTESISTIELLRDAGSELRGRPGIERYKIAAGIGLGSIGTIGHGSGGGSGSGYGSSGHASSDTLAARKDFRPNAVFSPLLHTDARGKVSLTVKMPESLTRFRVVALAAADTRYFGKSESTIVTQRKLNARIVAPRFLTQGDRLSLPVVVQNLDAVAHVIDVGARAANLRATGANAKRVTVPAFGRTEVRFDFATQARGRALIQTIARSATLADASRVELPVYAPATEASFATYGTVDGAAQSERLAVPDDIATDVGGVEVELAATELQGLTDAFDYLYAYPYECAEQRSARMLATAALANVLDAFATPGRPSRVEIEATRQKDLVELEHAQNKDGGFGYFADMASDRYVSFQVLAALAVAHASGPVARKVAAFTERAAVELLARIERDAARPPARRGDRSRSIADVSLAASALAALAQPGALEALATTGRELRARAAALHRAALALGAYPIDAQARVLAILARDPTHASERAALLSASLAAIAETAALARVSARYDASERPLLVSNDKSTALVLTALMREAPSHPLVVKLARGLFESRRAGRWGSTQANLHALIALREYFDRYERTTPNFTGKLWLGSAAYAERAFAGRDATRANARLGWSALPAGSSQDLVLEKAGEGRMYYRVGIRYAPARADLPALDAGFLVRRSYAAIDDPGDVARLADGSWKIRLGARVLVTLEAENSDPRYAVALIDPLPAGFEAVDETLATSERAAFVKPDTRWDHVSLRDNQSDAFALELPGGTHRFTYTARATTPGSFYAAPARAEEMYTPETFGRSTGQRVVIE